LNNPPTAVGGILRRSHSEDAVSRPDLNNPPTAVGGILRRSHSEDAVSRADLNSPPTTVGGISPLQLISIHLGAPALSHDVPSA
jgi:hypothetical protein